MATGPQILSVIENFASLEPQVITGIQTLVANGSKISDVIKAVVPADKSAKLLAIEADLETAWNLFQPLRTAILKIIADLEALGL